jgi:hypothetical protein
VDTGPDAGSYWELMEGETQAVDALIAEGGWELDPNQAPEIPFLYLELAAWEDDGEQDLMGIYSDTLTLAGLLRGQEPAVSISEGASGDLLTRTASFSRVVEAGGYAGSDNSTCWVNNGNGVYYPEPDPVGPRGRVAFEYEVSVTWLKATFAL